MVTLAVIHNRNNSFTRFTVVTIEQFIPETVFTSVYLFFFFFVVRTNEINTRNSPDTRFTVITIAVIHTRNNSHIRFMLIAVIHTRKSLYLVYCGNNS